MFKDDSSTGDDRHKAKSDDSDYATLSSLPSCSTDFEVQECKPEPGFNVDSLYEVPLESKKSPARHIPVETLPIIKKPVILLERCDRIWQTLQLIKNVQSTSSTTAHKLHTQDQEEQEDNEAKLAMVCIKNQHILTKNNTKSFQFSVQKTKKLYPCLTCGKQYLERRSLRHHALKIHGIFMPLLRRRYSHDSATTNMEKDDLSIVLANEGSNNFKNHSKIAPVNSLTTNLLYKSKNAKPDINSFDDKYRNEDSELTAGTNYAKCILCQQKVKSVKKHLIHYHKIGYSSVMMKQLESSLLNDTSSSSKNNKPMLKDILSGKLPQISVNEHTEDRFHTRDNEDKVHEMPRLRKKRRHTFSYADNSKKFKLNNGYYISIPNGVAITQRRITQGVKTYECDICLGIYSTAKSLGKHKRIHAIRGETKENFHTFECRYFNSPLNKKYQLLQSSLKASDTANGNVQTNTSGSKINGIAKYSMNEDNDTTCLCGRKFRNPHTLFIHKNNCKLNSQEDKVAQDIAKDKYNNDVDSGIGIHITIKKRNNSYEIVGRDSDEDKQSDDIKDSSTLSNVCDSVFDDNTKSSTNTEYKCTKENQSVVSEYSKDHNILKLKVASEDEIIEIEDDVQVISEKVNENEIKQTVSQEDNTNCPQKRQDDAKNASNEALCDINKRDPTKHINTLKQMCHDVLEKLSEARKQDTMIQSESKRYLRSSSKTQQNVKKEYNDDSYDSSRNSVTKSEDIVSVCGYCNKQFDTVNLYNKHQCTVKEGKKFETFSQDLLCFCCDAVLNNCTQFDQHMRSKHFDQAYCCYLCPQRFNSEIERNRHCSKEHTTSCRFCHKILTLSMKALHECYHLGFGYPCHKCKKGYSTKKKLSYHNTTVHKSGVDNMVFCNLCLRSIKLKTFRNHMNKLHNKNECHFCGKMFTDRTGIEYHTLIYHRSSNVKLKCSECGTRFFNKKQLEEHEAICSCDSANVVSKECKVENTKCH